MEKQHHSRVACTDSRRLTGSIDLDTALRRDRPNDNRWGYGLGYKPANGSEQAVWIEVHPAKTCQVGRVLKKLQWLKDWLSENAEQLKQLSERANADIRYVWIASGDRVAILKNSSQAKQLAQSGLSLKEELRLP